MFGEPAIYCPVRIRAAPNRRGERAAARRGRAPARAPRPARAPPAALRDGAGARNSTTNYSHQNHYSFPKHTARHPLQTSPRSTYDPIRTYHP